MTDDHTPDTNVTHARNFAHLTDDPYYVTLCAQCGGIDAAWSAFNGDIKTVLDDWKSQGRKVAYLTFAPRMSCSCGMRDMLAERAAEIERLKARQITPEFERIHKAHVEAVTEWAGNHEYDFSWKTDERLKEALWIEFLKMMEGRDS